MKLESQVDQTEQVVRHSLGRMPGFVTLKMEESSKYLCLEADDGLVYLHVQAQKYPTIVERTFYLTHTGVDLPSEHYLAYVGMVLSKHVGSHPHPTRGKVPVTRAYPMHVYFVIVKKGAEA